MTELGCSLLFPRTPGIFFFTQKDKGKREQRREKKSMNKGTIFFMNLMALDIMIK